MVVSRCTAQTSPSGPSLYALLVYGILSHLDHDSVIPTVSVCFSAKQKVPTGQEQGHIYLSILNAQHICCSVTQLCPTLCDPVDCSTPGFLVPHHLPEFAQSQVHRVGDIIHHLILCHLLLLPSVFPSIRVFSSESALWIRWSKYWSFSCSISLSNEYSGLNSFRIDWFDFLAVQGTLKSLLQHHSSKASVLEMLIFFMHIFFVIFLKYFLFALNSFYSFWIPYAY